jgi:CubicO group peptidase (beta-lactamase class C family)
MNLNVHGRAAALLGFVVLGAACSDPCQDVEIPAGSSVEQIARTVLDSCSDANGAPSGVIAVAGGGEETLAFRGALNPEGSEFANPDLVRIASVTKTFTAALILRLAQEGRLSLNDTIGQYVPGLPNGDRITLEHLLRMTSGLTNYTDLEQVNGDWSRRWTKDEVLDLIRSAPSKSEPGKTFAYNNSGYFLLGLVVEKVTGQTYEAALKKELLTPAGVEADILAEGSEGLDGARIASGHDASGKAVSQPADPNLLFSAGVLVARPRAMLRFARALDGNVFLSPESLSTMRSPGPVQDSRWAGNNGEYAMGLTRMNLEGADVFGHPGGHPSGADVWFAMEPKSGTYVFVQFNKMSAKARGAAEATMAALLRSR